MITEFERQVLAQLDGTWKNLRQIAEGAGGVLSGSGWQTAANSLVKQGWASAMSAPGLDAPMGLVYRRSTRDDSIKIIDANGQPFGVGCRVAVEDNAGMVVLITDPDGDEVNGHGVFYPPRVTVDFGGEDMETFETRWTATGPWDEDNSPFQCEDVEVTQ